MYPAFAWAVFTLGAVHLAFMLGGPIALLVVMFGSASLFAFFLFKVQDPQSRSQRQYVTIYLLSAGLLIIFNAVYIYLVFLEAVFLTFIFISISVFLFLIPLLVAILFVREPRNVSR